MKHRLINWFLALSRVNKRLLMIFTDVLLIILVLLSSFSLRLGEWYWPNYEIAYLIFIGPIVAIPIFIKFGLYRAIVRYIGFRALWAIVQAVTLFALFWGVIVLLSGIQGIPRSVIIINWVIGTLLIGGSRAIGRWWFSTKSKSDYLKSNNYKNVLVYGAGSAGVQLATALNYSNELNPVAFIDDDSSLLGHQIMGLKIYPSRSLEKVIESMKIQEILLAMPSLTRTRQNEIINYLDSYSLKVRTVPGISELAQGNLKIDDLLAVKIDDLLGRDMIPPNKNYLRLNITNKIVMVTGAGGSIGSELCRQIIKLEPKQIILFDHSEFFLYSVDQDLNEKIGESEIIVTPILGSVLDKTKIEEVCRNFSVQTIYHAAAYKHVPMIELNIFSGIENNVLGTLYCAQAAIAANVEVFVLISTDKAVRPTNIMGATKRFSELILQSLSDNLKNSKIKFSMVRFGNVLGSSGSVIPLFERQIKNGGPITVTDPEVIRYFMTIPEAAQLVIQAGSMSKTGGDVFILDMGQPIKILDLAIKMIRLSGLEVKDKEHPNGDIEIIFTGLRPGEKLYEELLIGDSVFNTEHELILRSEEEMIAWSELEVILEKLTSSIISRDYQAVRGILLEAVPGYTPKNVFQDLMFFQK
jgi:UDP-N-acetylglucosamine 4,6-dehydratase